MKKILSVLAASALLCVPAAFSASAKENCGIKDILSDIKTTYTYSCDVNGENCGCDMAELVKNLCGTNECLKLPANMQEYLGKTDIFAQLKAIFEKQDVVPELPDVQPEAPEMPELPDVPEVQPEEEEQAQPDNNSQKDLQHQVLDLVNSERAKNGLSRVTYDGAVACAAQKRAVETETLFSHTRPDGSRCFTALDECGASYRGAGENIAMGQATAREVMDDWMNSDGHRANILNPSFTKLGVGVHKTTDGRYCWTQMFIY